MEQQPFLFQFIFQVCDMISSDKILNDEIFKLIVIKL